MSDSNIPAIALQLFGDAKSPTGLNTPFVYSLDPNKGVTVSPGNTPPKGSQASGLPIDCSSLLQQSLLAAGYNVNYLPTSAFRSPNGGLSTAASKFYTQVTPDQVQPGDIILTSGHVGIIASLNPDGTGKFYGSQSSTGPGYLDFNLNTGNLKGVGSIALILRVNESAKDPAGAAAKLAPVLEQRSAALDQLAIQRPELGDIAARTKAADAEILSGLHPDAPSSVKVTAENGNTIVKFNGQDFISAPERFDISIRKDNVGIDFGNGASLTKTFSGVVEYNRDGVTVFTDPSGGQVAIDARTASVLGQWIGDRRANAYFGIDGSVGLNFETRLPDGTVSTSTSSLRLGWLSSAAVGGFTAQQDGSYKFNLGTTGNALTVRPDGGVNLINDDFQILRNWGIGKLGSVEQLPSGQFMVGEVQSANGAGTLLRDYILDPLTGLLTAVGNAFVSSANASESPSAAQVAADAAALQQSVGTQVGVTSQPANTVADNSRLQAGATNLGVSQQQTSVFPDPQPGAPGGYGFNTGDSFGGTPIINTDGMLGVAQSYLVTGNIRPGAQQTQAIVSDLWTRIDTDGGSASLGAPVTDPVPYLSDTLRYSAFNAGANAIQNIDPLVLDLDGDGVELSSWIEKNIFFDTVGDGKLHQTGWVADKDGILSLDLNGNGKIDDITETLSVHFNAGATPKNYVDGIAALASLAQAGATVFSRATSRTNSATGHLYFDELRVWIDANHDAKTDAGELKSLDQLGIASISLVGSGNLGEAIAGNDVMNRTTFKRSDGSTGQVASIDFQVDGASLSTTNVSGATVIKSEGSATVVSYVVTDTTGRSINASTFTLADGSHPTAFYSTGGNDSFVVNASDTRGYWLGGGTGSLTLKGGAGSDVLLINANTLQANIDGGGGFDIVKVNDVRGVTLNLATAHVEEALGDIGNDTFNASGTTSSVFIDGGGGNDILIGGIANDAIGGGKGDDYIDGGRGNDVLRGGDGDDLIFGGEGDDVVFGEAGNDTLIGGAVSGSAGANVMQGGDGDDILIGTGGYTVASYRGSFGDYSFTRNADGTVTITDSHADRDGTDTLKDVSALDFADVSQVAVATTLSNFGYGMPVDDRVNVSGAGPYVIAASQLLANDKNYAGSAMSIRELLSVSGASIARGTSGQVVGGTAALSADGSTITFTPAAGFSGVMKFKYHVQDATGKTGAIVRQIGTTSTAEMAGTVYLNTSDQPAEELFNQQWYLPEVNLLPVWKDYTGRGVSIAVFDPSGNANLAHPDLAPNGGQSIKVNGNPGIEQTGVHATLVAGIIGSARDGQGVVGVAYNATISTVALPPDASGSLKNLGLWKNYDIVNNSWNFDPAFSDSFLANRNYEQDYIDAVSEGRGGKGTILVFAAGNDRGIRNTNDLNLTNSLYGITVAGINAKTDLSSLIIGPKPFSTQGETILVSAPGSNIVSTGAILTSSTGTVLGSDYANAEGTSFAAPIVSGIVALMLEANPNLGYRDIQDILAYSAHKVSDPTTVWQTNLATNWNGRGLHYSRDYGFGEVDARAAVRLAETWQAQKTSVNLASTQWASSQTATVGNGAHVIFDSQGARFEFSKVFPVSYAASVSGQRVEHVEAYVDLDVDAYPLNDIQVILEPIHESASSFTYQGVTQTLYNYNYVVDQASILLDGEQSVPANATYVTGADGHRHLQFVYGSVKYRGEDPGTDPWVLRIIRKSTGVEVTPSANWQLRFFGQSSSSAQQWIFTDEYAGGATINPVTAGDSFNASAATGNNIIDLRAGSADSRIDNLPVSVAASGKLAHGFGGDGNDTLFANDAGNFLYGGRGNDTLTGGAGNDILDGGQGNNTLTGGGGYDTYRYAANDGSLTINNGVVPVFDGMPSGEIELGDGFSSSNLWFQKAGSDLQITELGTKNQVTVTGWFAHRYYRLDRIVLADGTILAEMPINVMADAMTAYASANSNFNPQADGQTMPTDAAVTAALNAGWSRSLLGTNADDTLDGGNLGNNVFVGNGGNDTLIGGSGIDTAIYSGNAADYQFGTNAAGRITITDKVAGRDGTDTLTGIEYLQFADRADALPVAHGDTGTASLDQVATLTAASLLANDTDPDAADARTLVSVSATSALGAAVSIQNGNVVYDPRAAAALHGIGAGQSKTDTFTYVMKDATGAMATATVTMTVQGVDGPPTPAGVFRIGTEIGVNTQTQNYQSQPKIAKLAGGGFVVSWTDSYDPTGNYNNNIKAQRFDATGNKVGSEILVNSYTGSQDTSGVVGLSNGKFVVTWHDYSGALGGSTDGSIKAQLFNADGSKSGGEFLASTITGGSQAWPSLTSLSGGGLVVAFDDNGGTFGTSARGVVAQIFDGNGTKVGNAFLINTPTGDWQALVQVAGLSGGGFVATWDDEDGGSVSGDTVKARIFDANGNKVGSEFKVNTSGTPGTDVKPMVTALAGGGFVVAWWALSGAKAQLFDATGNKIGSEIAVTGSNAYSGSAVAVSALANGGFAIAWSQYGAAGETSGTVGLVAQLFDVAGNKLGSQFLVNSITAADQWTPSITGLSNANFAVAWQDTSGALGDTSNTGIVAQLFGTDAANYPAFSSAMASAPTLRVQGTAGNAGSPIALSIASELTASDGAQSLSLTISGLPPGATLSAGTQNGDGSWSLTPLQLMNLKLVTAPASTFIGIATLTVTATEKAMNGSSASMSASVNVIAAGTTSAHDAQNRLTSTTTVNLDGSKTVTTYDAAASQPWSSQVYSYNSAGNLLSVTTNNDDGTQTGSRPDGSHWSTIVDAPNHHSWASFRTDIDDSGRMTSQAVINDNQIKVVNAYNPVNATWTSTTVYDAAGRMVSQAGTNPNGTHWLTGYDVSNQYSWSSFTNTYSGITDPAHPETNWTFLSQTGVNDNGTTNVDAGQIATAMDTLIWYSAPYLPIPNLTFQTGTNADGSTWSILTDTADQAGWATIRKDYTASGALFKLTGTTDGGSSWVNLYDVTGSAAHTWEVKVFDAGGQPVSWSGTNRSDGTHFLTVYDPNHQYTWFSFTIAYNAGSASQPNDNWSMRSVTIVNDDGSTSTNPSAIAAVLDIVPWYASPYDPTPSSPPAGGGGDGLPVVLDLDGDGVHLTPLGQSVATYDMSGDGRRDATAWTSPGDGFLAIDLAADGTFGPDGAIDRSEEIVFSAWDRGATSDMQALRDVFDTNHNGKLDAADAHWSDFRVWQDADGNGTSSIGEVKTLDQLGIASIDLNPTGPVQKFADGSVIQGSSAYTRADGTIGTAADVALAYGASSFDPSGQVNSLVQSMTAFDAHHSAPCPGPAATPVTGSASNLDAATLAPAIVTLHQAA